MIYHCDNCNYTFGSSILRNKYVIPTRCPDCGKQTARDGMPAVRAATEDEIASYEEDQRVIMAELADARQFIDT